MTKFIFITGGVVSSLGKGIASSAIGALLQARGFKIRHRKMDPYLNINPSDMSLFQHGEVFITDDGAQTDLDLGHYERFSDTSCHKTDSISGGKIYWNVLNKERNGEFNGGTVQAIPHITNELKLFINSDLTDENFVIYEIGGTVGDMEGVLFLEAIRQFMNEVGRGNVLLVHLTLVPYIKTAGEIKTKPTQQSVRKLLEMGLSPNIILCRSDNFIPVPEKKKIAMFCNVKTEDVISAPDIKNIYEIPIIYHNEGLDSRILNYFNLTDNKEPDMSKWQHITDSLKDIKHNITIGLVANYCGFTDAYKSLFESLNHSGIHNKTKIDVKWIDANKLSTTTDEEIKNIFADIDAIISPDDFEKNTNLNGKIKASEFARNNNVPYLALSLGFMATITDIAENILKIKKEDVIKPTDNLNIGAIETKLDNNGIISKIYNKNSVFERHKHKYEIDDKYIADFEKNGIIVTGKSNNNSIDIIEIPNNKFFVGCIFHPEYKSRPFAPAPIIDALVKTVLTNKYLVIGG